MLVAVRRTSEARRLSTQIAALESHEDVVRSNLARALVRADSLGSRSRLIAVAAELGLRPSTELDIQWLPDAPTVPGGEAEERVLALSSE